MSKPRGLEGRGTTLWNDITGVWTLRPDEQRILEHACRTADELQRLQDALKGVPVLAEGSTGQPRSHPLVSEVRGHRDLLAKLLKQLALPDVPVVGVVQPKNAKAQAAANTRWNRVRDLREAGA